MDALWESIQCCIQHVCMGGVYTIYIHTCIFHGNNHIQLTIGYAYNDLFLFRIFFLGLCFVFRVSALCSLLPALYFRFSFCLRYRIY